MNRPFHPQALTRAKARHRVPEIEKRFPQIRLLRRVAVPQRREDGAKYRSKPVPNE